MEPWLQVHHGGARGHVEEPAEDHQGERDRVGEGASQTGLFIQLMSN